MLEKVTSIEKIEIDRQGSLNLLISFEIVDEGEVIQKLNHRTVLEPGSNIDAHVATVNAHITSSLKKAAIPVSEVDRIKTIAETVWTPEVIQAYQESLSQEIL